MNTKRTFVILVMTLVLAVGAFAQAAPAGTHSSLYGQNFLSSWQTLRLVADNPRYADGEIIPCIRVRMIATFFELPGDGSVRLRAIRRVTREFELDPGEAATFDLPAMLACDGSVCPQIRNGVSVAVSVFATPVEGEPIPARLNFNTTLTIREFNRTVFVLPVVQKGFDPQPDPPSLSR